MLADIANFFGPLVRSGPKTAYALPGMMVDLQARLGTPWTGVKHFIWQSSGLKLTDPITDVTTYTDTKGLPVEGPYWNDSRKGPDGNEVWNTNMMSYWSFYAPKDPGTYSITVEALACKVAYTGMTPSLVQSTITDTLTLIVEAPTVELFEVQGNTAARSWLDVVGVHFITQGEGEPGFEYVAVVTNNTHYWARVGFIQVATLDATTVYEGQQPVETHTQPMFDRSQHVIGQPLWYDERPNQGWYVLSPSSISDPIYPSSRLMQYFDPNSNMYKFVEDNPAWLSPLSRMRSDNTIGWLQSVFVHMGFATSVAVEGGGNGAQNWPFASAPMALSTARWDVQFSATHQAGNILDPHTWTFSAAPAQPSTHGGDGLTQYPRWAGNAQQELDEYGRRIGALGQMGATTLERSHLLRVVPQTPELTGTPMLLAPPVEPPTPTITRFRRRTDARDFAARNSIVSGPSPGGDTQGIGRSVGLS